MWPNLKMRRKREDAKNKADKDKKKEKDNEKVEKAEESKALFNKLGDVLKKQS